MREEEHNTVYVSRSPENAIGGGGGILKNQKCKIVKMKIQKVL